MNCLGHVAAREPELVERILWKRIYIINEYNSLLKEDPSLRLDDPINRYKAKGILQRIEKLKNAGGAQCAIKREYGPKLRAAIMNAPSPRFFSEDYI